MAIRTERQLLKLDKKVLVADLLGAMRATEAADAAAAAAQAAVDAQASGGGMTVAHALTVVRDAMMPEDDLKATASHRQAVVALDKLGAAAEVEILVLERNYDIPAHGHLRTVLQHYRNGLNRVLFPPVT